MHEDWIQRLKAGYDSGYYRTEVDADQQIQFPWQNKACVDCPFWLNGVCRVYAAPRDADAHTCSYFDQENREAGRLIIERNKESARRAWWGHFS